MQTRQIALFLALLLPLTAADPITRVAAGSCYKPTQDDNGIWETIAKTDPQLFLFMGDNIYGDTEDMGVLKEKYNELTEHPGFQQFRSKIPIIPTWDDHDYGANDAGKNYPKREESQKIFLDTFDFPADHPARQTPGIYHSTTLGPKGQELQIITLDTRYFRSDLKPGRLKGRKAWLPDPDPAKTLLGEAQWEWLETELKKPAALRLIVSSIQVITTEHRFEKWANLPLERQKFLTLLAETNPGPTILLSGDRHCGEIARLPRTETNLPFDLYEMTSSGLTHAGAPEDSNSHRIGPFTSDINFGTLEIDWSGKNPVVDLVLRNHNGTPLNRQVVRFEFKK